MYIVGFNISVSWKFWQPEVNSQCLAMASREHGAVEVDVAVAGGVPGEIFLSCYNIVPHLNLWAILLISTRRAKLPNELWINQ